MSKIDALVDEALAKRSVGRISELCGHARELEKVLEDVLPVLKKNGYRGLAARVEALLARDLPAATRKGT